MKRFSNYWQFILLTILCVISRLPQLLSPELLLDGDECVSGLMAKHFIEGKEIPVFFHGQSYGFSFIETALISLFYLIAGMNDLSVKLPMLLLWTAGILFFYQTLAELNTKNKWLPLLITLVFIFAPSWALWSMKARGGYLTAFFFSSLLTWLLFGKKGINSLFTYFFIGLILVIIYQSQPLWLPGLLPLLAYKIYHQRSGAKLLSLIAGSIPVTLLFLWFKQSASNHWSPKVFDISLPTFLRDMKDMPFLLFDHFNGYYFLYYVYNAPLACKIFSCLFIVLIVFLVAAGLWYLFKNFKEHSLFIVSVLSILFTIGYNLFITEHAPRYLIPLTGFVLLSFFIFLDKIQGPRISALVSLILIAVGIPSLISFKDYTFYPARKIEVKACVDYLQKHDIKYCFSNDGLLQWQIAFYSGEKIICRESDKEDRYPEYVQAVTNAYYNDRQHVAIIDNTQDLQSIRPQKTFNVISHFYILLQPDDELMKGMDFKF